MSKTVSAVVVCAGNSVRMGGTDKIFSEINGVPVFIRTLAACAACAQVCELVIVTKEESFDRVHAEIERFGISKPCVLAVGGSTVPRLSGTECWRQRVSMSPSRTARAPW